MADIPTDDAIRVATAFQYLGVDAVVEHDRVIPSATGEEISVHRFEPTAGASSLEPSGGTNQIFVADRLTSGERHRLRSMGVGWFDLRGHISFRSPTLIIDADVPAQSESATNRSVSVLAGEVVTGVTVMALTVWPAALAGVRATVRIIGSSPGGASLAIKRLVSPGMLTSDHHATPGLFWSAAAKFAPVMGRTSTRRTTHRRTGSCRRSSCSLTLRCTGRGLIRDQTGIPGGVTSGSGLHVDHGLWSGPHGRYAHRTVRGRSSESRVRP